MRILVARSPSLRVGGAGVTLSCGSAAGPAATAALISGHLRRHPQQCRTVEPERQSTVRVMASAVKTRIHRWTQLESFNQMPCPQEGELAAVTWWAVMRCMGNSKYSVCRAAVGRWVCPSYWGRGGIRA
ncbi:hypothetical protein BO86DRAFT_240011 [Aspergillus japonicus CBS 114.51]|uniref:Uncharacterized protein n=2 Tax=Aspergillus TaxID=5052 RepID=A0A2V5HN24_ASPV1|nr:hypothetical protein BO86DRAFT_240011 [Aspergillus japonicus CBS 114.51]PYI23494.1 hypothetical protein BO99DRAFT_180712 [Aspergillus violaceofuscus CBS 115571]RAH84325.1 hypothetical protein BO86DRAFT_240011 [Aspergillus japonicus CBS 114.51]